MGGSQSSKCKVNFVPVSSWFLFLFYIVSPSANGNVTFNLDRIEHVIKSDCTFIFGIFG